MRPTPLAVPFLVAALLTACGGGTTSTTGGSGTSAVASSEGSGPKVGDHWHAAYGMYVCDHFITPIQNANDVDGVHTHGDGVIHAHPFNNNVAGTKANLAALGRASGFALTDTSLTGAEIGAINAGDDCHGKPEVLEVVVWDTISSTTPRLITTNLSSVYVAHDAMAITIAAVPAGTTVPKPPWTDRLTQLGDVPVSTTVPPASQTITGATPCPAGTPTRIVKFEQAPPMCIDPMKHYTATITTTEGVITVDLDAAKAPKAVNVFVTLARYHTYDGTELFRIIPAQVIMGGDPVGVPAGSAGVGFTFNGELPSSGAPYVKGAFGFLVDDSGKSAGQFFLLSADLSANQKPTLPIIGTWQDSAGTVPKIDKHGTSSGYVFDNVTITSITIAES